MGLLLSACDGVGLDQVGTSGTAPIGTSASSAISAPVSTSKPTPGSSAQLRFAPGDKIKVIVFGEDKLSGDYQIDAAGTVSNSARWHD
jgi:polysaccharide export outer membrane protein